MACINKDDKHLYGHAPIILHKFSISVEKWYLNITCCYRAMTYFVRERKKLVSVERENMIDLTIFISYMFIFISILNIHLHMNYSVTNLV